MNIDKNTYIINPKITLQWVRNFPYISITANYENQINSYSRLIGKFTYNNGWIWEQNNNNTTDVINYFNSLKIEDLNIDNIDFYTPPTLTPYAVIIPEVYQWAFPQDKFILGGFEIPLDTHNSDKVVNIAYFMWAEFRAELDSGKYNDLKRALMPLWDYVELQVNNQNLVVL